MVWWPPGQGAATSAGTVPWATTADGEAAPAAAAAGAKRERQCADVGGEHHRVAVEAPPRRAVTHRASPAAPVVDPVDLGAEYELTARGGEGVGHRPGDRPHPAVGEVDPERGVHVRDRAVDAERSPGATPAYSAWKVNIRCSRGSRRYARRAAQPAEPAECGPARSGRAGPRASAPGPSGESKLASMNRSNSASKIDRARPQTPVAARFVGPARPFDLGGHRVGVGVDGEAAAVGESRVIGRVEPVHAQRRGRRPESSPTAASASAISYGMVRTVAPLSIS